MGQSSVLFGESNGTAAKLNKKPSYFELIKRLFRWEPDIKYLISEELNILYVWSRLG